MSYKIPLVKESFYKEKATKENLVNFVKNSEKFSMGEQTKKFEEVFSKYQNSKYCVFFSSGSAANLALIQSLKNIYILKNDDNIAISSLTWSTNVMPIMQLGMRPIPIDIEIDTLNISIEDLKSKFDKYNFRALFLTNALSLSCNMQELVNFCRSKGIILIEDNCESLGSEFGGVKLGNFGLAGTMSFFIGHQMSSIEGGCVVTNDENLYEMLKKVRAHGWSRDSKNFTSDDFYSRFTFQDLAFNLRPTEINAVVGLKQMEFLDENLEKRHSIFNELYEATKSNKNLYEKRILNNFYAPFAFPIIFKNKENFNKAIEIFNTNQIEIRPVISGNITKQPFFKKYYPEIFELPNCDEVHEKGFYFGINPSLTKKEIEFILDNLKKL